MPKTKQPPRDLWDVVEAVTKFDVRGRSGDPNALSHDDAVRLRDLLRSHRVTVGEFMQMDDKPGYWGYDFAGLGEWHWKLRQMRNQHGDELRAALRP